MRPTFIQTMVSTDIPVDGRMFTCVNCHQRSGLGSEEGSVITWPVNGKELFTPRRRTGAWNADRQKQGPRATERWSLPSQYQAADARPEYTDETLAQALREGVDPTGRILNRAMPHYQINNSDMSVLSYYLKNLSIENDPGVDKNRIRFATVVTDDVSAKDKEAMLAVLKAHMDTHNTQTRPHQRRAKAGPFYKTEKFGAYRLFDLDVWELTGLRDTWQEQLDTYYQTGPVFAMLGGIADGSWSPIHHFCEEREIPCIFPVTDQPVVSDSDWYTLYFLRACTRKAKPLRVTCAQLSTPSRMPGLCKSTGAAVTALCWHRVCARTWESPAILYQLKKILGTDQPATDKLLHELFEKQQPAAVLLWLDNTDMVTATNWLVKQTRLPGTILASWKLLEENASAIPDNLRDKV